MNAGDLQARILANSIESPNGCLEWQRSKQRGYGKMNVNGRAVRVHRVACEIQNGPAPEGKPMALHKCNNRACVRGDHLYWGDGIDNMRDCMEAGDFRTPFVEVEECKRGHAFTGENTYLYARKDGQLERKCKACNRARSREWMRARRAKAVSE